MAVLLNDHAPRRIFTAEEDEIMRRFIFPEEFGITGTHLQNTVLHPEHRSTDEPMPEFQAIFPPKPVVRLRQIPCQLVLKITRKLNSVSFCRMARTGKFVNHMIQQAPETFNISLPDALILRGHSQYGLARSVTVMKDRSKSPLYDIRDPHVDLWEAQWSTVKYFSFNEIVVKCDVFLYDVFKPLLKGRNIGCIYEQNNWVNYDYVKMFSPRKLRVCNIDSPLCEIIRPMNLKEIICDGGVDPVVDTEAVPHLAKVVRFKDMHLNPLADSFPKYIKEYIRMAYSGKMKELHITSSKSFLELMPKDLLDKGEVWSGSMIRCVVHRIENRPVCAMFRTADRRNCIVFGLETVVYVCAFNVATEEDVVECMREYPFMFNDHRNIVEPLFDFVGNFLSA